MKAKALIIFFLCIVTGGASWAVPARRGAHRLVQPDGSTFMSVLYGDEFTRIRMTADGHAIIQDTDGWWSYASYDQAGNRHSTGWHVGSAAPTDVISSSRDIPYTRISERAREKRQEFARLAAKDPFRLKMAGMQTKSQEVIQKHGIVILAQFKDVKFKYAKQDFEKLLKQEGYNVNGSTGSAKEYFDSQFNGKVNFTFDVSDIVTVQANRAYYGSNDSQGNDKNPAEFIAEACRMADEKIDFSVYDDDKDGVVDNVFVFFAGEDEAEHAPEECLWAHSWYVYSGAGKKVNLDGCWIDRYACASELSNGHMAFIGTFCHEYSHTFGLPDMYDTDYESDKMAAGLWSTTSLMDGGNYNNEGRTPPYFNAVEREILGLSEASVIADDGHFTLLPINESNNFYRMETDSEGEYYLFECRKEEGWDAYIGGSGMLVYHIDKRTGYLDKWEFENNVNAYASHQCADLVEADARTDIFTDFNAYSSAIGRNKGLFFPYENATSLTPDGRPALKFWSGNMATMSITGITRKGNGVEFNVTGMNDTTSPPLVNDLRYEAFNDAAIISFESDRPYDGEAVLTWKATSGAAGADTLRIMPYESGKYAVQIEGLIPSRTYTFTAVFRIGQIEGKTESISFMTRKKPAVTWPFIYLGANMERKAFSAGAKIPLKVYNASDAVDIIWTFDGKQIKAGGDCYHTIGHGGILKAYVHYEDGSTEVLIKEITIDE